MKAGLKSAPIEWFHGHANVSHELPPEATYINKSCPPLKLIASPFIVPEQTLAKDSQRQPFTRSDIVRSLAFMSAGVRLPDAQDVSSPL